MLSATGSAKNANSQRRRRERKLSFNEQAAGASVNDHHCDQDEVRSVGAGISSSSCSGEEVDDACSQSDISLIDDGGSEGEEGENSGLLGHLSQHSKKGDENQGNNSNSVSSKMSDEDGDCGESETAWNFNDFIELAEKDN